MPRAVGVNPHLPRVPSRWITSGFARQRRGAVSPERPLTVEQGGLALLRRALRGRCRLRRRTVRGRGRSKCGPVTRTPELLADEHDQERATRVRSPRQRGRPISSGASSTGTSVWSSATTDSAHPPLRQIAPDDRSEVPVIRIGFETLVLVADGRAGQSLRRTRLHSAGALGVKPNSRATP